MDAFTPVSAVLGGLLIGAAAVVLLAGLGRVMGVSGIFGAVLHGDRTGWRIAFLIGLVVPGIVVALAGGAATAIPAPVASLGGLVLAGLLVGVGVRMGSGCTSGHGVCGLARLSRRSIAAVAVFFATTAVTVFVVRHVLGLEGI